MNYLYEPINLYLFIPYSTDESSASFNRSSVQILTFFSFLLFLVHHVIVSPKALLLSFVCFLLFSLVAVCLTSDPTVAIQWLTCSPGHICKFTGWTALRAAQILQKADHIHRSST